MFTSIEEEQKNLLMSESYSYRMRSDYLGFIVPEFIREAQERNTPDDDLEKMVVEMEEYVRWFSDGEATMVVNLEDESVYVMCSNVYNECIRKAMVEDLERDFSTFVDEVMFPKLSVDQVDEPCCDEDFFWQ